MSDIRLILSAVGGIKPLTEDGELPSEKCSFPTIHGCFDEGKHCRIYALHTTQNFLFTLSKDALEGVTITLLRTSFAIG